MAPRLKATFASSVRFLFSFYTFFPFPFRMEGETPCACPGGYAQGFLYLIKMWQSRTDKGKSGNVPLLVEEKIEREKEKSNSLTI